MKEFLKILNKIRKGIFSYLIDIIMWIFCAWIVILIFQYILPIFINFLGATGVNILPILIVFWFIIMIILVYAFIQSIYNDKKKIKELSNLIKVKPISRTRIEKKISSIFKNLDEIRFYKRQIMGIRDWTPLVQRHRYITPNKKLVNMINRLEKDIINDIRKNPTEETVDKDLNIVIQIHKDLIDKLNKIN